MESYRHALYRYSTGIGFNANVDVPEKTEEVTAYQFKPLMTRMDMDPNMTVDLRREADRISMQVEDTERAMKNIGYDEAIGKDFKKLKIQLEVMQHLFINYPIRYIRTGDLQKLYSLYEKNTPGMDSIIAKVVEDNKDSTGITAYTGTAYRVRKGYPLFDSYGRKLKKPAEALYKKDAKKAGDTEGGLSGFSDTVKTGSKIVVPVAVILLLIFLFKK